MTLTPLQNLHTLIIHAADSYSLSLPAPAPHAEQPLDEVVAALAWHLLGSSQRLAEQYRFTGHWKLLEQWLQQLIDLRALLSSLGQAAPRVSSHALREALDALLAEWRPRIVAGQLDEAARQVAPQQFAAALKVAEKARKGSAILAMLPDTGERYLSTFLFEGISEESDDALLG